jgi:hypothetical protein
MAAFRARRSDAGSRPRRYLDLAESYADVARVLATADDIERPAPPLQMLVAHAMELALKAVIARGRCDDAVLILLGHDLPLCLRVAIKEGLELDRGGDVEAMVDALAMPHLAQTLRYPAHMSWPLPDAQEALGALATLLLRVAEMVGAGRRPRRRDDPRKLRQVGLWSPAEKRTFVRTYRIPPEIGAPPD